MFMIKRTASPEEAGIDFSSHIFASPSYLAACGSEYGWFVGKAHALPYYIDRILLFRRMVFTTAPIPFHANDTATVDLLAFLNDAVDLVFREGLCDFISKPQSNAVFAAVPDKAVSCQWGTFVRRIDLADDELLKSFHYKHRNVICKAIRDGVTVGVTDDACLVQGCIQETLSRQNVPYYPSLLFVKRLVEAMPVNIVMMAAHHEGVLQGVALVPYDNKCGYYLYGGSSRQPYGGALNLLQYEVMRQLRDKGVTEYDFVGARLQVTPGSKFEGIQRFKSRFGARLVSGYAFRVVCSPLKYWLFSAMARTYFRLRGWTYQDAIDEIRRQSGG